jgi:hypothetical protein
MDKQELQDILKKHSDWLNGEGGEKADLSEADLSGANLRGADLDFSTLHFSCKTLKAKFDQKHIIQILYHAAAPCKNDSEIVTDPDLQELLKSEMFIKVVNKFHRVEECGELK